MIYLATPYSHPDRGVRYKRYREAVNEVVRLTMEGHVVYSPIVYWHEMAEKYNLPTDHLFWKRQNEAIMLKSDMIVVDMIDGWDLSKGVEHEIQFGNENGITVIMLNPGDNI